MPQITSATYNLGNPTQRTRVNNFDKNNVKPNNVKPNNISEEKIIKGLTTQNITVNNIPLDAVMNSINGFKTTVYNNYYLLSLVNKYKNEIISAGRYDTVLQPIIEKSYLKNENYFWIVNAPLNSEEIVNTKYYFTWKKNSSWNNLLVNNIPDEKAKKLMIEGIDNNIPKLNKLLNNTTFNNTYYKIDICSWVNGLNLYIGTYIPDLLNENKWIEIGSGIDLISYFPQAIQNNFSLIPQEYFTFIEYIKDTILYLNKTNWKIEDINNIWQLTSIALFPTAKCLLSTLYPDWTGKLINECFIPQSNFNYPSIMNNTIIDLNNSYPTLTPGQFIITTNIIEKSYYISLIQITQYNGIKSFKEKQILVNDFFKSSITSNGDVLINGSLNVTSYDKTSVIQTDNVSKITTFHDKVGINQEPYEVKALLDIDNISVDKFISIMDMFKNNQLNSYNVLEIIKSSIPQQKIPVGFNNIVIFKAPIKNVITENEIIYTNRPQNGLLSKNNSKLSVDSFNKISILINEVNKMKNEIDNYYSIHKENLIHTFTEILDDEYNYLCNIRGYIYENEMYFITSFLNVENIISDNSYKKNFKNIISKISSANRFVNYSVLVFNIQDVNNKLFPTNGEQPDSLSGFTSYINNSDYFKNRFGIPSLYALCGVMPDDVTMTLTKPYDIDKNYGEYNFIELNTTWNGKKSTDLFITSTDNKVNKAYYLIMNQIFVNYNFYKNNNFGVYYNWINGMKYSICYLFEINNKTYLILSGIDLVNEIDNSILTKGDTVLVGDLTVRDNNNNPIFSVSNINNSITSTYNIGIGLATPTTTLDVNDAPIYEILDVIKQLGFYNYTINSNISKLQNATSDSNFSNIIENDFIDPYTGKKYIQSLDSYFGSECIPSNYKSIDTKIMYNWLYKNWNGYKLSEINDPQNKNAINSANLSFNNVLSNNIIYEKSGIYTIYNWTLGIKVAFDRTFKYGDNLYTIGGGVNLQVNNIRYNTNANIPKLFNCISTFQMLLQTIVAQINGISLYQQQYLNPLQKLFNNMLSFDKPVINKYKIYADINSNKFIDSVINYGYGYDYRNNQGNLPELFSQDISYSNDVILKDIYLNRNEYTKIINLITNIFKIYGVNNENTYLFNVGDYGIVYFDDEKEYFVSIFYCNNINTYDKTFDIISIEFNLTKIIVPTLKIKGDSITYGEIATNSNIGEHNFFTADPNNKFIGINTDDRKIFYDYTFNTDKKTYIKDHHVYIKNNTYPNLLCERIWETNTNDDPVYINQFGTFSSSTMKRRSDLYTFKNIYDNSLVAQQKYGTDIAFEFSEKTGNSQEIGNIGMTVDKYDEATNIISGGFQVVAKVIDMSSDTNNLKNKTLLYVNNDSELSCNSVKTDNVKLQRITTLPNNPVIGQMQYLQENENDYLYVCVSTNPLKWKKTILNDIS
jgi:hypothetical protein